MHVLTFFKKIKSLKFNEMVDFNNIIISKTSIGGVIFSIDFLDGDKIIKTDFANLQELLTVEFLKKNIGFIIENNQIK